MFSFSFIFMKNEHLMNRNVFFTPDDTRLHVRSEFEIEFQSNQEEAMISSKH